MAQSRGTTVVLSFALQLGATVGLGAGVEAPVTFDHEGQQRSAFVFVPEGTADDAPLLLLLHGSGRDGQSILEPWRGLADREKVILVAPNSARSEVWDPAADGVYFLRAVLARVAEIHGFAEDRVLLFGHSGGAVWALQVGLIDSRTYAAVSVHAGLIPDPALGLIAEARIKRPYQVQVGAKDRLFPPDRVRPTVEALETAGFRVDFVEIPRHDHDYYRAADRINATAWTFFSELAP